MPVAIAARDCDAATPEGFLHHTVAPKASFALRHRRFDGDLRLISADQLAGLVHVNK
jgi:hypothetical protein